MNKMMSLYCEKVVANQRKSDSKQKWYVWEAIRGELEIWLEQHSY